MIIFWIWLIGVIVSFIILTYLSRNKWESVGTDICVSLLSWITVFVVLIVLIEDRKDERLL
jgi:hypothetical protein